jgi:Ser/Thr protein kinase RdoA (MazF antagonist)
VSSVLDSAPPQFTAEEAARIAADMFGVHGTASALGSERDQAFLLENGVLKISNPHEDEAVLDLEEAAIAHVAAVDPDLPVARQLAPRATFEDHQVRLFERRHGNKAGRARRRRGAESPPSRPPCLALRSFFHPAAGRQLLWNLRSTPRLRPLLDEITDPARRALVARMLERYDERVLPQWERLRGQVVHGDFNLDNLLVDVRGGITGILDFGDCCHSALVADDLVVALASSPCADGHQRTCSAWLESGALDGFASRLPLEPLELEVLGDRRRGSRRSSRLARRAHRFPRTRAYIEAWDDDWQLLELFDGLALQDSRASSVLEAARRQRRSSCGGATRRSARS